MPGHLVAGDIEATTQPPPVVPLSTDEKARQRRRPASAADEPTVQADPPRLMGRPAFGVEAVEGVVERGEALSTAAGLAPVLVPDIAATSTTNGEDRVTVVLVGQRSRLGLKISWRGYVLETGWTAQKQPAMGLFDDDRGRRAY